MCIRDSGGAGYHIRYGARGPAAVPAGREGAGGKDVRCAAAEVQAPPAWQGGH